MVINTRLIFTYTKIFPGIVVFCKASERYCVNLIGFVLCIFKFCNVEESTDLYNTKCIRLMQHRSEASQKKTMPSFRYVQKIDGPIKIFCYPKAQFFLLECGRGIFTIISFSFVNIRHRLYVLLISGIFDILFAANDFL